jgi:hypothetical protein
MATLSCTISEFATLYRHVLMVATLVIFSPIMGEAIVKIYYVKIITEIFLL